MNHTGMVFAGVDAEKEWLAAAGAPIWQRPITEERSQLELSGIYRHAGTETETAEAAEERVVTHQAVGKMIQHIWG